jgi:hypothetical protein
MSAGRLRPSRIQKRKERRNGNGKATGWNGIGPRVAGRCGPAKKCTHCRQAGRYGRPSQAKPSRGAPLFVSLTLAPSESRPSVHLNGFACGPWCRPCRSPSTPYWHWPCSFGLISRISSHPAVFFSHNKPANSAFSTINQRNEQADYSQILERSEEQL